MSTAVVRPAKLAHIVLRTGRYAEVIAWWKTVLGAEDVHAGDVLTFITFDDEHHRLAFVNNPGVGDEGRNHAGLEHVAFTYDSFDDLVVTYERLRDIGIVPILPINHGMTLSLYYADPDGNQCELQIDISTNDEAIAFMESPVFEANPIGVVFDPEVMAAQHRAGEPIDAIASHGPRSNA